MVSPALPTLGPVRGKRHEDGPMQSPRLRVMVPSFPDLVKTWPFTKPFDILASHLLQVVGTCDLSPHVTVRGNRSRMLAGDFHAPRPPWTHGSPPPPGYHFPPPGGWPPLLSLVTQWESNSICFFVSLCLSLSLSLISMIHFCLFLQAPTLRYCSLAIPPAPLLSLSVSLCLCWSLCLSCVPSPALSLPFSP